MDRIRFSNLYSTGQRSQNFFSGGNEVEASPTDPTTHQGGSEFVFDANSGTFASLQEPPSFFDVLNDGQKSYSYIL
tara:strand:- start:211 stop:438 length:228 start_codon:yes stop_codon:yes gene_type:complete